MENRKKIGKKHLVLAGAVGFVAAYLIIALELKLAIKSLAKQQG